jgi:chemotaxis protein MotB
MARNPWRAAEDSDFGAFRPQRGRFAPVLMGVMVAAIATFIAAYYVPLYRAHRLLGDQHRALSQKSQALSQKAQKLEADLEVASRARRELEAERLQRETASKAEGERLDRLRSELAAKLDRYVKKGSIALAPSAGVLVVALDENLILVPQKLDVLPGGRVILCDVAKIAGARGAGPIRVFSTVGESAAVTKEYPTAWALSAARAASVVQTLSGPCSVGEPLLTAVGAGKTDVFAAALSGAKLPAARIEMEIGVAPTKGQGSLPEGSVSSGSPPDPPPGSAPHASSPLR